ncbi:MAG TPA: YgiT-type zinc finger protein [Candidatus Nanoarchaeia archaeon]|nr:YgiT-type zinc finger protein [Candidatus Nanoarchaeia archaeon]
MKTKSSRNKCYECGGRMVLRKKPFKVKGILLGKFPAEVCTKCGEVYFDEKASDEITRVSKEKGLWGIEAVTRVGKIGDSLGVIINKRIADFIGLKKGEQVKVYPQGRNKIVIEI